ncbi:hypothetical protein BAOM_3064 [Peribacillus asahii]|uniref:Uncharacterized protein n=1 Tax=Peribacillus asahii TaxID=228899 RepID=A0A3Q9RP96_9BACI|nr:hypothetical protein [Peribacillus asahii]AZV43673.1 hypothetical protein BAOM_3064 [Peribacillus asahii]
MKNYNFEQKIKNGGYKKIVRTAENILLRPNDNKLLMGEERLNALTIALEKVLEDYKHDEVYNYYYEFNKNKHGFCTFERWKCVYMQKKEII